MRTLLFAFIVGLLLSCGGPFLEVGPPEFESATASVDVIETEDGGEDYQVSLGFGVEWLTKELILEAFWFPKGGVVMLCVEVEDLFEGCHVVQVEPIAME